MREDIIKVNRCRSMAIFKDSSDDYEYFEMLGDDSLEDGNSITGNLHSLSNEIITKLLTGEKYDIFIEDYGMSLKLASEQVFKD